MKNLILICFVICSFPVMAEVRFEGRTINKNCLLVVDSVWRLIMFDAPYEVLMLEYDHRAKNYGISKKDFKFLVWTLWDQKARTVNETERLDGLGFVTNRTYRNCKYKAISSLFE